MLFCARGFGVLGEFICSFVVIFQKTMTKLGNCDNLIEGIKASRDRAEEGHEENREWTLMNTNKKKKELSADYADCLRGIFLEKVFQSNPCINKDI